MTDLFFTPSPQQAAFFRFVEHGEGHGVLQAAAGSGKTTTLLKATTCMSGTVFLGAFNKAIATEIGRRLVSDGITRHGVTASTMHSAGFTAWRQMHPKAAPLPNKLRKLARQIVAQARTAAWEQAIDYAIALVGFAQNAGIGLVDPRELHDDKRWLAISAHFDADRALPQNVAELVALRLAQRLMRESLAACPETVTFDEMLYAPIHFGTRITRYDHVLVDEAQDSSVPRIELAARMVAPGGRLLAVGDQHQAIYGFAGADSDAMSNIIVRFDATVLPLSVSFRCPRDVVRFVQQFVGAHIEASPEAPAGSVRQVDGSDPAWAISANLRPDDAILCRINRPLVALAYALLRHGIPCRLAGRQDIGARLKALARRWDSLTLNVLEIKLGDWLEDERKIAASRDHPERAETAENQVETLRVVMDRCRGQGKHDVTDLLAEIDRLFAKPDKPCPVLSSIHKAKGLEWPRVFWVRGKPSARVHQQWQQQQESNLDYVAATRAKRELVLVEQGTS